MIEIIHRDEDTGELQKLEAVEGWSLMEILRDYALPIKAECGGACCCATCHVYVDFKWVDKLPSMSEDEQDMLDQAPDVKETSRLSCQILIDESLNGLEIAIVKQKS